MGPHSRPDRWHVDWAPDQSRGISPPGSCSYRDAGERISKYYETFCEEDSKPVDIDTHSGGSRSEVETAPEHIDDDDPGEEFSSTEENFMVTRQKRKRRRPRRRLKESKNADQLLFTIEI